MDKVYIVGNPNSGKTTLFNRITKSSEHVGNWHGVTVDKKSKIIKFKSNEYELVDLPGIYSLNAFSLEEQVSVDEINLLQDGKILYLLDANNFKRGMLLALTLLTKNKNIKILINNYTSFQKKYGQIDIGYLKTVLGCEVEIVNAQKIKVGEKFFSFKTNETAFIKTLKNEIKNIEENNFKKIEILYKYIIKIDKNCVKKQNSVYGYSKFDKKYLKLKIYLPLFIVLMFGTIYCTFFLIGPVITDLFLKVLYLVVQKPVMAIVNLTTKSKFIIAFFENGIFGSCFSVLGFLPQIALMYMFLSIFENSGLISRVAFLLDDALQKVGLNGKMVYTLLMGFGCSTTATLSAKNMNDKKSQIKASLLTPFISCSAKLPIYTMVAGALFGVKSIWVILGLYLLGIVMAIVLAVIYNNTILNTRNNQFIIEFAPLQKPKFSNIYISIKNSCKQFVAKVFSVIFCASVILWLVANLNIKFEYVDDINKSILYSFSSIISWAFKPIGLNNPNIVCALLVGLVAKELILSSFAISNKVSSLAMLSSSLTLVSSAVYFNKASAISFLIFTLLYFPCVSNFGVLLKQVGLKFTLFGCMLQLLIAYLLAFVVYSLITKSVGFVLLSLIMIFIIVTSAYIITKKIKNKKFCHNCLNCNKCNKI